MGYPKYMTDEQLAVFGFAVSADNPTLATHKIYPTLTVRYRCPRCNLWASTMMGGKELVCEQCFKGGRPIKTNAQFKKIYRCCQSEQCKTWRQLLSLLHESQVPFKKDCHDGYGEYIELDFPTNWSLQDRIDLHWKINDYCVSKYGGRKAQCKKTGKLRSRIPGSRK